MTFRFWTVLLDCIKTEGHLRYPFRKKRLYVVSIPKAPKGAVINIARTATVKTMFPHGKPKASGIEPMAAWTVAFGI